MELSAFVSQEYFFLLTCFFQFIQFCKQVRYTTEKGGCPKGERLLGGDIKAPICMSTNLKGVFLPKE